MYSLVQKFSDVDMKLPENVKQYGFNVDVNLTGDIVAISGLNRISVFQKFKNEYLPKCFDVIAADKQPYIISLTEQNVMYYISDNALVKYDLLKSNRKVFMTSADKLFGKCLSVSRDNRYILIASNNKVYSFNTNTRDLMVVHETTHEIINVLCALKHGYFCEFNSIDKTYKLYKTDYIKSVEVPAPNQSCNVTGFGLSLSYCESTGILCIGGPLNYFNKGAVWLYDANDVQTYLEYHDSNIKQFGTSVELRNDVLVVCATDTVLIYQKKVDSWALKQKIDASGVTNCKLSTDLSTLVVGCPDLIKESVVYVYYTDAFITNVENLSCSRNVILKHRDVIYEMKIDNTDNLNIYKNAELVFTFGSNNMFKTGIVESNNNRLVYVKTGPVVNCVLQVLQDEIHCDLPFKFDIPPPNILRENPDLNSPNWSRKYAIHVAPEVNDRIYIGSCIRGTYNFSYTTNE
jgi:hypothetical protein